MYPNVLKHVMSWFHCSTSRDLKFLDGLNIQTTSVYVASLFLFSVLCLLMIYVCVCVFSGAVVQLGPNVSISANARIGAGARLVSCIILDDVEIQVLIILFKSYLTHF